MNKTEEEIERRVAAAEREHKRKELARQIDEIADRIKRARAYNSLAPCLGEVQDVYRDLEDALQLVKRARLRVKP